MLPPPKFSGQDFAAGDDGVHNGKLAKVIVLMSLKKRKLHVTSVVVTYKDQICTYNKSHGDLVFSKSPCDFRYVII